MPIPNNEKLPSWIESHVPEELVTSELFRFEVTLRAKDENGKRKKITVDILPDINFDMETLEEDMQDLPAQYAFWSSVYSELRYSVSVAERRLKRRRGEAINAIHKEMKENKTRISVEQQKLIIETDELLMAADLKLAEAHMLAGKIYHMMKALEMKHENCRSLIGLKKAEYEKS